MAAAVARGGGRRGLRAPGRGGTGRDFGSGYLDARRGGGAGPWAVPRRRWRWWWRWRGEGGGPARRMCCLTLRRPRLRAAPLLREQSLPLPSLTLTAPEHRARSPRPGPRPLRAPHPARGHGAGIRRSPRLALRLSLRRTGTCVLQTQVFRGLGKRLLTCHHWTTSLLDSQTLGSCKYK